MTITFKLKNGDVPFSSATGRPFTVQDSEKLSQDARENMDTAPQANGTGADLDGVIPLVGDVFALRAEISRRLEDSFAALRQVQNAIQRSDRTAAERFSRIAQVTVLPIRGQDTGTFSMTSYAYRADLLSVAGGQATTVTGVLNG